jgi:hypothetical protein
MTGRYNSPANRRNLKIRVIVCLFITLISASRIELFAPVQRD